MLLLVNLVGRISLRRPLNSKVCLNWNPSHLFEPKDVINILRTSFSPAPIYGLRTSHWGHKSNRPENNLVHNIQNGPRTRVARGISVERFLLHALTLESDWPFPTFLTVNTIISTISQFHELLLISITWYQRALYNKFCDLIGYATRYLILDGRWVKWQGLIGSCILQPQSHCKTCDKPLVDLNKYCLPLWRKANARNVSFVTIYCGQFTFSTQLIKLNYPVLLIQLFRS